MESIHGRKNEEKKEPETGSASSGSSVLLSSSFSVTPEKRDHGNTGNPEDTWQQWFVSGVRVLMVRNRSNRRQSNHSRRVSSTASSSSRFPSFPRSDPVVETLPDLPFPHPLPPLPTYRRLPILSSSSVASGFADGRTYSKFRVKRSRKTKIGTRRRKNKETKK
ncbi:hypothetical protein HPP92_023059 [Vanilla planifolia]|uniref:Uncharacterized protein n=1 Tax=Vanilla planifolia TaxID=51239 RepID=A0A835PWV7_VANPL|nr:hypothetical protein HPP92_023059 [Vanilla planifolia]